MYVTDTSGALSRILSATTAVSNSSGSGSASDEKTTYYVYGYGLISQECAGEQLYYHYNNIGSTEAVTDSTGAIVERFEYGPYGELLSENESGIIFLYNGQYGVSTDDNGLIYMRARYYNPEIKRFINQDVLTGSITDSPTMNRYAYVNGNPISLSDPFGLSPALSAFGHAALDFLGLMPGLGGVIADYANAFFYLLEGNHKNSCYCALSGLPGLGKLFGTTKYAKKLAVVGHLGRIAESTDIIDHTIAANIDRYLVNGEKFNLKQLGTDILTLGLVTAGLASGLKGISGELSKVTPAAGGSNTPATRAGESFVSPSNTPRAADISAGNGGAGGGSSQAGRGSVNLPEYDGKTTYGTCVFCNNMTPTFLPEGASLTVIPPSNAIPNNSRVVAVPKTYIGNEKIPKISNKYK